MPQLTHDRYQEEPGGKRFIHPCCRCVWCGLYWRYRFGGERVVAFLLGRPDPYPPFPVEWEDRVVLVPRRETR